MNDIRQHKPHRFSNAAWTLVLCACIALLTAIGAASSPAFAVYTEILRRPVVTERLAEGVTHEEHRILTTEGWLIVHVVRADLRSGARPLLLTPEELSRRETLSAMVSKSERAVLAAVNGDFFDTGSRGVLGQLVRDGRVLASGIEDARFAHFSVPLFGAPRIHYNEAMRHEIFGGGERMQLDHINKMYFFGDKTICFDEGFGKQSPAAPETLEALVVDGRVAELRRNGVPFELSHDRYVLASSGADIADFERKFPVGTALSLQIDRRLSQLGLSFSGGTKLVHEGRVAEFTHNVLGHHPRTAVGLDWSRNQMMLVTVDGRSASHRGLAQSELAALMIELGAYEALNLDGGGSTQMVVRSPFTAETSNANTPSDGRERGLYNAVAIAKPASSTAAPTVRELRLSPQSTLMLVGIPVDLRPSASDQHYNPIPITGGVRYTVSGVRHRFEGDSFVPLETGVGQITAEYGGVTASMPFRVENAVVRLQTNREEIRAEAGEAVDLIFTLLNENGERFEVPPARVEFSVTDVSGVSLQKSYDPATGRFFAPAANATGYITFRYRADEQTVLSRSMRISVGSNRKLLADFETPTAALDVYPSSVTGTYLEIVQEGRGKVGFLSYNLLGAQPTRAAYMKFAQPLELPANSFKITAQVFGSGGNEGWLRAKLVDSAGVYVNIDLAAKVDWQGWREVSGKIPAHLKQPVKLDRIYVVETDASRIYSGYVFVDRVEAIYAEAADFAVPEEVHRMKSASDYRIPDEFAGSRFRFALESARTPAEALDRSIVRMPSSMPPAGGARDNSPRQFSGKYPELRDVGDLLLLTLDNRGGLLRANNGKEQWDAVMRLYNGAAKPIVVLMSDPAALKDDLENELFLETFSAIVGGGLDVAVLRPAASGDSISLRRERGILFADIPETVDKPHVLVLGSRGGEMLIQAGE